MANTFTNDKAIVQSDGAVSTPQNMVDSFDWRPNPEFSSAKRAEYKVIDGEIKLTVFDLSKTDGTADINWDIYGIEGVNLLAEGKAETFDLAKEAADKELMKVQVYLKEPTHFELFENKDGSFEVESFNDVDEIIGSKHFDNKISAAQYHEKLQNSVVKDTPSYDLSSRIPKNLNQSNLETIHAFWNDKSSLKHMMDLAEEVKGKNITSDRYVEIYNELFNAFGSKEKTEWFMDPNIERSPLVIRFGYDDPAKDFVDGKLTAKEALNLDLEQTEYLEDVVLESLTKILHQKPKIQQKSSAEKKRVYLAVPYSEKDQAKAAGAKWDRKQKSWFAPQGVDLQGLDKWKLENQPKQDVSPLSPVDEFGDQLKAQGVVIKGAPLMDGKWHRASLSDDAKGTQNASYRAFLDGRPNGQIKNFKTAETIKWVAQGERLSPEKRAEFQAKAAETQATRIEERLKAQSDAKNIAAQKWDKAEKVDDLFEAKIIPKYLLEKNVTNHNLRVQDGILLVPAKDIEGELWSVQTIDKDGTKRFQKGGRKTGLMHVIDPNKKIGEKPGMLSSPIGKGTIFIAEGYATAASVHEATKRPTVVAFDAGNLKPVAEAIRKKYPNSKIVIASDNDHKLERKPQGNVGLIKAVEAAQVVGGSVVKPGFTDEEKELGLSDWNDLANAWDKGVVAKQMRQQLKHQKHIHQGYKPEEKSFGM